MFRWLWLECGGWARTTRVRLEYTRAQDEALAKFDGGEDVCIVDLA
jgi:hypothetical protein